MMGQKEYDMSEYKLIHLGEVTSNQTLSGSKWVSEYAAVLNQCLQKECDGAPRTNSSGN